MGSPACEFAVCMFVSVRERDRDRRDTESWLMGAGEEFGSRCVRLGAVKTAIPVREITKRSQVPHLLILTLSQCCSADVISTTDSGMSTSNGWYGRSRSPAFPRPPFQRESPLPILRNLSPSVYEEVGVG